MNPVAAVDRLFADFADAGRAPGVAYGVVSAGALRASGGFGLDQPAGSAIFRIASMTKSFVAAAVLMLRDRGAFGLDDQVGGFVPQLSASVLPTGADAGTLTIRQLLTMSAGLPTDDPWADRLEDLSPAEFDALLARGLRFAHLPGTRFEYSNLGFAILGRIVGRAAGRSFRDVIRTELLDPLGLHDTGFAAAELDPQRIVTGHRRTASGWSPLPQTGPGEFSAIGGLYSTVEDLSRWMSFFLDATTVGEDDASAPLSKASRREMQQLHRFSEAIAQVQDGRLQGVTLGYGFGLFVRHSTSSGEIVHHSGGYPGFGSHMCWSPEHGVGVVALANATYAPTRLTSLRALEMLLATGSSPTHERSSDELRAGAAAAAIGRLVVDFRDDEADALFAPNMDLDEPREERRARFAAAAQAAGTLRAYVAQYERGGGAVGRWHGDSADIRIETLLTPEQGGRLQSADVDVVPAAPPELERLAQAVVLALNESASAPAEVDQRDYALAVALGTEFTIDADRATLGTEPAVRIRSEHADWLLTGTPGEPARLRLRPQTTQPDQL